MIWFYFIGWCKEDEIITLNIRGKKYYYNCSPYIKDKFLFLCGKNRGKALAFLKSNSYLRDLQNV